MMAIFGAILPRFVLLVGWSNDPAGWQAAIGGPVLLLGIGFYLIISGSSFFGLLHARASRRLGDISYGIYLLQGLVLFFVFSIGPVKSFALASPARHWSVICLCALLLMAVAASTHHFVELRGIRVGKHIAALVGRYFWPKASPTKNRLQHP